MEIPWEDMIWVDGVTAEELQKALDRRNAEISRVTAGVADGSIVLELIDDED